jgi:cytochrome c-type biogenesis protein CcmH/NrfG
VAGHEVPARYFQFVRTQDPTPLRPVLEHNRLDLLALAALAARLLQLLADGAAAVGNAREAIALGCVYAKAGQGARAREAWERALTMSADQRSSCESIPTKIEALRLLAVADRRARRFTDAAVRWRELLSVPGCPPSMAWEAAEALAIHHEHRLRDLGGAKSFALRCRGTGAPACAAVDHRLARIDRKMRGTFDFRAADAAVTE